MDFAGVAGAFAALDEGIVPGSCLTIGVPPTDLRVFFGDPGVGVNSWMVRLRECTFAGMLTKCVGENDLRKREIY
jgi:hypothetical protein